MRHLPRSLASLCSLVWQQEGEGLVDFFISPFCK